MCRKNVVQGWCLAALGVGILLGHSIESFWLSSACGIGCLVLGVMVMGKRR